MVTPSSISIQRGTTLIEILVTIVILVFGLLGLAGLQARLQVSEMEAYQRSQALVLLEDMAGRISANRAAAATYVTGSPVGTGMTCASVSPSSTVEDVDSSEWCNALQGAAEVSGGSKVGAMIGARGCVESMPAAGEYMVTIAWQGLAPISAPPVGVACGLGSYDGGACTGDRCRRVVTTIVRIGAL